MREGSETLNHPEWATWGGMRVLMTEGSETLNQEGFLLASWYYICLLSHTPLPLLFLTLPAPVVLVLSRMTPHCLLTDGASCLTSCLWFLVLLCLLRHFYDQINKSPSKTMWCEQLRLRQEVTCSTSHGHVAPVHRQESWTHAFTPQACTELNARLPSARLEERTSGPKRTSP